MNRRATGFTLIELLVVVAIVAIMLMLAAPSFVSFMSNYRATSATNDFLQGVTLTRAEALKRGHKVLMVPNMTDGTPSVSGSWNNGWTIFVDNDNNQMYTVCPPTPCDELIYKHSALQPTIQTSGFSAAGTVTATAFVDGSKTYVQFDGTGFPRLLNGTVLTGGIVITDTSGSNPPPIRTLCIGRMGRPQIIQGTDPYHCALN